MEKITAELIINAYTQGVFPMAESAKSDAVYWVDPEQRGIIPLDQFHVSRRLARKIRQTPFDIRIDNSFIKVIEACALADPDKGRGETWINDTIIALYARLFDEGFIHTVECWQDDQLVGGLYGVSLNGAFCGESMFHRASDASKIALCYLVARLKFGGYQLLDTQFITPHLAQFGAREIPRKAYHQKLARALTQTGNFYALPLDAGPETILNVLLSPPDSP